MSRVLKKCVGSFWLCPITVHYGMFREKKIIRVKMDPQNFLAKDIGCIDHVEKWSTVIRFQQNL